MTQVWCCGVAKGAKIVFERGKMVKADSLQSLNERMKTMDLDKNEIYPLVFCLSEIPVYKRPQESKRHRMQ